MQQKKKMLYEREYKVKKKTNIHKTPEPFSDWQTSTCEYDVKNIVVSFLKRKKKLFLQSEKLAFWVAREKFYLWVKDKKN